MFVDITLAEGFTNEKKKKKRSILSWDAENDACKKGF